MTKVSLEHPNSSFLPYNPWVYELMFVSHADTIMMEAAKACKLCLPQVLETEGKRDHLQKAI